MPEKPILYYHLSDTKLPVLVQIMSATTRTAIDLQNVATLKFVMYQVNDDSTVTELVNAPGTVTDAANGKISYIWQAGDTNVSGKHIARFVLSWNDGTRETFPERGHIEIVIEALP